VRFVGQAELRIVRGAVTVHEVKGALLYWDNKRERFGAEGETLKDGSTTGRFKWTLSPASAPASAPTSAPANAPSPAGNRK
jgi:hypothetical protein